MLNIYWVNKYKQSLKLLEPYLKILDNDSLASSLRKLVEFDFDWSSLDSFKIYETTYKSFILSRRFYQLEKDFEELVEKRAKYFENVKDKKDIRRAFYEELKCLIKKKSIKSFNDAVLKRIHESFDDDFTPDLLFDESFIEYLEWKEKSKPFKLLATYWEILTAIDQNDNEILNKRLKELYIDKSIECPLGYKILIIQTISRCILNENINIHQDIIMKMTSEFEMFESKDSAITNKYIKRPISESEKQSIRYSLNQASMLWYHKN